MIEPKERKELGVILKRLRKKRGWSLENVVKMVDGLSPTTLSKIERGVTTVGKEFVILYCKALKINPDKIPSLLQKETEDTETAYKKLLRIEKTINLIKPDQAYKHLKKIEFPRDNHLQILYLHLEGRTLYFKRQYHRASKKFNTAIQLSNKYPEIDHTNLQAACYCELARISYFHHNNLTQALKYSEMGIEAYRNSGMRQFVKLSLLSGKASYLQMMQEDEEAFLTVEELLKDKTNWHVSLDAILNAIEIKSLLCAKKGFYQEALQIADNGIELARLNRHYSRSIELLTVLGEINFRKGDYLEAEEWYKFAIQLEHKIEQPYLIVSTYTKLGNLYVHTSQWEKAKKYLLRAVQQGEKNDDGIRYYSALVALGDFFIQTEQAEHATPHLETALQLSEKNNFPIVDPDLFLKLSHCLEYSNPERSQKYLTIYKKQKLLSQAK